MATNKHAIIRYIALDQCFGNPGRRYYIEDLIEACNNALYEFTGVFDGVKRRQIYDDIRFMESEQGWSIPLEKVKDGRRTYYRYYEKNYSIKNQPINETEIKQLKETLLILNRFKGMPQFHWIEEMLIKIESSFNMESNNNAIVGFENNPYLKGLDYFTQLFNAIQYKKVLEITYQGYRQEEQMKSIIHPYFLKQFNNRWFLLGFNEKWNTISNFALDRIIEIKEISQKYIENQSIDFEEYFYDVIGVTVKEEDPVKVILLVSEQRYPYIKSKPIHGSQKMKGKEDKWIRFEYLLQINNELISLILSYGEDIVVLEPESLKNIIKTKIENMSKNYF